MNPWHKRANEFIREPSELLPLVSPQPVKKFFANQKGRSRDELFDRLVVVAGSPGSGKTTLARLLELRTLAAMRDFEGVGDVRDLLASLAQAGVLDKDISPALIALRLPTGGQLRAIWDLPYETRMRHRLLRSMVQAKAVLGWIRSLEDVGVSLRQVRIVTTAHAEAAREAVSADEIEQFRERARRAERAIFNLLGALVAPPESELSARVSDMAYEPFPILEAIEIDEGWRGKKLRLRPMIMLDDAHELHPSQLEDVDLWLRDREVKVGRWILTRIDALNLDDFRRVLRDEDHPAPGTKPGRDRIRVLLQDSEERGRVAFKATAEDVARRYLQPLPNFSGRALSLKTILNVVADPQIKAADLRDLEGENRRLADENGLTSERVAAMENAYPEGVKPDVRAAITNILLQRELRRTPQRTLFGAPAEDEGSPETPKIKRKLAVGAELHLLHRFGRPFYYGFDRLADAANENIEQFVTLASVLVDQLETQAIRGKPLSLSAKEQDKAIRDHAAKLIAQWDFPYAPQVRQLVAFIASRCLDLALRPNAPLSDGANAYGVPATDLSGLDPKDEFARVLHYALAYQALVLIEPYDCKGSTWALFELGGVAIVANGLTLSRGGFAEGTLAQLRTASEPAA